ncbi:hypothetical protein AKJ66_03400, partial [candidate division MSBL1 archaeon SCGC-AAA259E22]
TLLEKVCRISDILTEVNQDPFLKKRLSLTGGTALNFIYTEGIPRLSVDLDFNYRHEGSEDWGKVRTRIDSRLKLILESLGYENLRINPSYPLGRINATYSDEFGKMDGLKLEIGYMRRFPFLKKDTIEEFHHVGKDESIEVLTPKREELFASKILVGLKRKTPKDVFDIATISDMDFDHTLLRKCAILESFTNNVRLNELGVERAFETVSIDTALFNLLRKEVTETGGFAEVKTRATDLLRNLQENLTPEEVSGIEKFYDDKEFDPNRIVSEEHFHEELKEHPAIRWTLKNL